MVVGSRMCARVGSAFPLLKHFGFNSLTACQSLPSEQQRPFCVDSGGVEVFSRPILYRLENQFSGL